MIAKRLTVLGACVGLVILFGWALEGWSKKTPATPCPAGRFLVDPGNSPLVQNTSTGSADSITIDEQRRISIGSGCLAIVGRIKVKSRFTMLTTKWPSCGSAGVGRLNAKIASPDCGVMVGRFKTKGGKAKPFTARRSTCGDGVVDGPSGEQCEPGGGCENGTACTAACTCESPSTPLAPPATTVTSSITPTTLQSTTSTVTSSTTPTTLQSTTSTSTSSTTTTTAYTCGGLGRRCSGTCPDGQTCVSTDTFPQSCVCQPTCGASAPACNGICPSGETCRLIPRLGLCECSVIVLPTTTTTIPCHATGGIGRDGFPACGGECPPGQICFWNPFANGDQGACECNPG